MCGICGYIGSEDAYQKLMDGLKMLQNRGYDSAGICTINGCLKWKKYASVNETSAIEILDKFEEYFKGYTVGIAHTRWATHGPKTDDNSHPHICYRGRFALVHNGIIENYYDVKEKLLKDGIPFNSQTDTEVIVNLISYIHSKGVPVDAAIKKALSQLEGTWGIVILCIDEPTKMYCARHGSPLLVGFSQDGKVAMVASEQSGFCKYVNNYLCLKDNDIVELEKTDNGVTFHKDNEYEMLEVSIKDNELTPDPYLHWTLKEIYEQTDSSVRALGMGGRIKDDYEVKLGGLSSNIDDLKDVENIILLGCGTSYHAGLHCLPTLKRLCGFNTVQIFDGAEFSEYDIPKIGKTAIILLSQSGETKDLHHGLRLAQDKDLLTIGVINVVDSMIAREVSCGVYLNAGREVGVASTKAFTSQVLVLNLIALFFSQIKVLNKFKRKIIIEAIRRVPLNIKQVLDDVRSKCFAVAEYLKPFSSVFVLGRGVCESVAKEGALKIKEIGYIHAEGYSSSALKHGPYSLIEDGTPIIIISPEDEFFNKNLCIIEEVKSRGAYVIAITDTTMSKSKADIVITVPKNVPFRGLLAAIPLQFIAYELACLKGHSPDFPRNLAKTVTVL